MLFCDGCWKWTWLFGCSLYHCFRTSITGGSDALYSTRVVTNAPTRRPTINQMETGRFTMTMTTIIFIDCFIVPSPLISPFAPLPLTALIAHCPLPFASIAHCHSLHCPLPLTASIALFLCIFLSAVVTYNGIVQPNFPGIWQRTIF